MLTLYTRARHTHQFPFAKFLTVPISPQLKRMFEGERIFARNPISCTKISPPPRTHRPTYKCLQLRFEQCHSDGELSHVYDGDEYDFLGQPGCV